MKIGDKVAYTEQKQFGNIVYRILCVGIWDGEKAVLDDGCVTKRKITGVTVVRNEKYLLKLEN